MDQSAHELEIGSMRGRTECVILDHRNGVVRGGKVGSIREKWESGKWWKKSRTAAIAG